MGGVGENMDKSVFVIICVCMCLFFACTYAEEIDNFFLKNETVQKIWPEVPVHEGEEAYQWVKNVKPDDSRPNDGAWQIVVGMKAMVDEIEKLKAQIKELEDRR
jgi:hypothetical protein